VIAFKAMKIKIKHIQQPQIAHRIELPGTASLGDTCAAVHENFAFSEGVAAAEVSLSLNKKVWCPQMPLFASACLQQHIRKHCCCLMQTGLLHGYMDRPPASAFWPGTVTEQ
jgi:hypothetical protein